jgi:type I restriction enzyme, S subunit
MPKQLPSDWKWRTLGEIAEINPRSIDNTVPENTEVSFVPMANVSETTASIINAELRPLSEVRKGFTPFQEGDVLFAKITPCMENGKVAIAHNLANGLGFGSTEFHVIRPFSTVSNRWIWYFLRSPATREYAAQNMTGSAGQQRVPANFVRMLQIPVPPTPEKQEHIADLLDEVDAARLICNQLQREIEQFISLLFIEMFGDPETNPKKWEIVPLSELMHQPESGWSPKCLDRPASNNEFGVIKLSAVTSGYFQPIENKALPPTLVPRTNLSILKGNLLFSRANTRNLIGATALVEADYPNLLLADKTWRLHPKSGKNTAFLKACLSTRFARRQISELASGTSSSMLNISKDRLLSIKVPRPPEALQEIFTQMYWLLLEARQIIETKYAELDALLLSLFSHIFGADLAPTMGLINDKGSIPLQVSHTIWPKLSLTQRHLWEASQTLTTSFKVEELSERVNAQQGTKLNSEYVQTSMELLEALAIAIKENRSDIEKWRLPNEETDPDIEV